MPVYFDTRNKRWRYQIRRTISGRIVRASRLLPNSWNRSQAEAFDRAETARLLGLATGVIIAHPLIEDAVQLYLEHHAREHRNAKRCAASLALLYEHYRARTFADLPAIGADYIRDHRATLAPATIRNRLAYLRAACRWAWKHHAMGEHDPGARMVMPAVSNARHVYIDTATVHQLAAACTMPATAAIVRLAFYTGLRWTAELLPRTQHDIIKKGRTHWLNVPTTKNGQPRMVPVHPAAVRDLKYLPLPLHWRTYYADFERARETIGRPDLHMHDLRHSLASAIASAGGTIIDVQAALGHESVQSSKRYIHLYQERLRAVLWRVGGAGKKRAAQ